LLPGTIAYACLGSRLSGRAITIMGDKLAGRHGGIVEHL